MNDKQITILLMIVLLVLAYDQRAWLIAELKEHPYQFGALFAFVVMLLAAALCHAMGWIDVVKLFL